MKACPPDEETTVSASVTWGHQSQAEITLEVWDGTRPDWLRRPFSWLWTQWPEATFCSLNETGAIESIHSEYHYRAEIAYFGAHLYPTTAYFDTLELELEGCSMWFSNGGFRPLMVDRRESGGFSINYEPAEPLRWDLPDSWSLSYQVKVDHEGSLVPEHRHLVRERSRLTLKAPGALPFDVLLKKANWIIAFIEFATDQPVAIVRAFVRQANLDQDIEVGVCFPQPRHSSRQTPSWHFRFDRVKGNFGEHLAAWIGLYEKMEMALDLYRVGRRSPHQRVEFQLFTILTALEVTDSVLFGDGDEKKCEKCNNTRRVTLQQRFERIHKEYNQWVTPLFSKKDCEKLATTRNLLAHQTAKLKRSAFPHDKWYEWYRRMTIVFEICVLKQLPFDDSEAINEIVAARKAAIVDGYLDHRSDTQ